MAAMELARARLAGRINLAHDVQDRLSDALVGNIDAGPEVDEQRGKAVSLAGEPLAVDLAIPNNGVGTCSPDPSSGSTSGVGPRQRTERHGGVFSIRSEGGRTVLRVRIQASRPAQWPGRREAVLED